MTFTLRSLMMLKHYMKLASKRFDIFLLLSIVAQVGSETLRMVCTGLKGDWPYIRKVLRPHSDRLKTLPVFSRGHASELGIQLQGKVPPL